MQQIAHTNLIHLFIYLFIYLTISLFIHLFVYLKPEPQPADIFGGEMI